MSTPIPNSTLSGSTVTFTWNQSCTATQYYLYVGSTPGGNDIAGISAGANLSQLVTNIPTDGRTIYVELWSYLSSWLHNDYTYTAYNGVGSPVLTIGKSHTGNFTQGQTGTYTLSVNNNGSGATSGTVTVTDTLPTGLTASSMSGAGWANCNVSTVTCTRSDSLLAGGTYPPITLTVNVSSTAPSSVTNSAGVSGGGSSTGTASDVTSISSGSCVNGAAMYNPVQSVISIVPAISNVPILVPPSVGPSIAVYVK